MVKAVDFISYKTAQQIKEQYQTPCFIYNEQSIREQCQKFTKIADNNLTIRYAIKANPLKEIIKIIDSENLHFDASSSFEALRCLSYNIKGEKIQLTAQQLDIENLEHLSKNNVLFNACSLHQLEYFAKNFPCNLQSFRINPGIGSGNNKKTNVGGSNASFGIWHEYLDKVKEIIQKYNTNLNTIHCHIGSGADATIWEKTAQYILKVADTFPSIKTINLGGGFKIARTNTEKETSIQSIKKSIENIFFTHTKKYNLELEPGTAIIGNAGALLAEINDITDTGKNGYTFLKLNTGMDSLSRVALYQSQHDIAVLNTTKEQQEYIITGHCCESGDTFTIDSNEDLQTRTLNKASIGDLVIISGAGAYCSSMNLTNYNSFPAPAELLINNQNIKCIKEKQNIESIFI